MDSVRQREAAFEQIKKLLATQIKLDIATTIRQHPHIKGEAELSAYEALANDASVNQLLAELAHEEVQDAIARGQMPAASFLHLAGFRKNERADS